MAELLITLSDGRTLRHRLGSAPAVVGRDAACEIPIDDPSASRRHARFVVTAQGYLIEDLGSKNGTLLNDVPASGVALKDGDRILLGSTAIVFSERRASQVGSAVVVEDDDLTRSHATRYVSADKRLILSQRRLQLIYDLSGRLTTVQNRERLLGDALDICFETLQFERGAVALRREGSRIVDWPVVHNLYGAEGELTISRSLLARAMEHGERAMFTDAAGAQADPTMSMVQHGIRSAMCVPLIHQDEILGVMYGDRTSTSAAYKDEDIDFFAAIARQVSIGLINCRLLEEQKQIVRLNRDIDLARTIQIGLFPAKLPDRADFTVSALNEPGHGISGDYYDVIERPDGRIWCLIADVTSEGVAAALLMANLQAAVRATIDETDDPATLLARWNQLIVRNTDSSKFITCLLALVDPKSRLVRFAGAGHPWPLILHEPGAEPKEASAEAAFPLGISEEAEYTSCDLELGPGPFILFGYTDGVVEAMNEAGQTFGKDRLIEALKEPSELDPAALVKQVRKRVTDFVADARQSDDITMLAVRVG